MKQVFTRAFIILGSALLFFSCTKSNMDLNHGTDNPSNPGKAISISATLSDALTKVSFTPEGTSTSPKLALAWEAGDKLRVADHADRSSYTDFVLNSGAGTREAVFQGTPVSAASYDIWVLHQGSESNPVATQTQQSNGDTRHIEYVAQAVGVADLGAVTFSEVSSVLGLKAKLPSGVATSITSVELTASENIFFSGNTLTINLNEVGAAPDDILNLYATLPSGTKAIPNGTTLLVKFNSSNAAHTVYTRYVEFPDGQSFTSGCLNHLQINASQSDTHAGLTSCDGTTAEKAYLIADKYQLLAVAGKLEADATRYFKLVDDVDMNGISWSYLNTVSPYNQLIDFDGNYKTVSNLGGTMFYVFKGSVKNLTLDSPTITSGNKKGAFAQFIQGINNYVTNVDVSNVSTFAGSNGPCGGLVGLVNNGSDGETTVTFDGCDVSNVVVNSAGSSGMAGGLIGSVEAKVVLANCTYTGNNVANTYDYVGGLIGKATAEISISGSSVSSASISGRDAVGGLVGHCEAGGSLTSCSVTADVSGRNYIGGVVGRESTASGKTFSISKCSFVKGTSGLSASSTYAGGILGNQYGAGTITIENSYVNSPISAAGAWAGGISSNHYNGTLTITKCYVMGSVSALYGAAGIVGQVRVTNLTINPVAVYVTSITATDTSDTEHESSGTIVAYGYNVNVTIVRNCWYDQTLTFAECTGNAGNPGTWCPARQTGLTNAKISKGSPHDKIYPYWGRYTNPSDYPLNKMCKEILEFSSDVWNLDVNPPILK